MSSATSFNLPWCRICSGESGSVTSQSQLKSVKRFTGHVVTKLSLRLTSLWLNVRNIFAIHWYDWLVLIIQLTVKQSSDLKPSKLCCPAPASSKRSRIMWQACSRRLNETKSESTSSLSFSRQPYVARQPVSIPLLRLETDRRTYKSPQSYFLF